MLSERHFALVGALACAGCAQIVGADFDVVATGGASSTASSTSSATSTSSSTGGSGPVTLAADEFPFDIVVDDTFVYWTSQDSGPNGGAIRRVGKDGQGLETLTEHLDRPNRIALGATDIYWTNSGALISAGSVMRMPKTGGPTTTLASGVTYPIGIAVDDTEAFFTTGDVNADPNTQTVYRIPLMPLGPAVDFLHAPQVPAMIAIHQGRLWGTSSGAGNLWSLPVGGGALKIERDIPDANGLVECPNGVVAAGFSDASQVVLATPSGGQIVLSSSEARTADVASDGVYAYWANFGSGEVRRALLNGGTVETLATGLVDVNGIAVDADSVFVTTYKPGGVVLRLPKPP